MTSVASMSRSAAYLTKANIVHPIVDARPSDFATYVATYEAGARTAIGDRFGGVTVTGGAIKIGTN